MAAAPSTSSLLTQWYFEPSVVAGIIIAAAGYWLLMGRLRERYEWGPPPSRRQVTYFAVSEVLLIVALLSPIDYIGDRYLFSVHMVQHLLLASAWPPLFLLSFPSWFARLLFRLPGSWLLGFLTYPATALLLFNIDIYAWHVPAFYDLTLRNEGIHVLEHLSFMFFGLFNWWPVLSPAPGQRLAYPLQVLYLFVNMMLMMGLGILFTFAPTPFYPPYVAAPRLWGISPIADQQIGGLIMWYPGNLAYFIVLVVAFFKWVDTGGPKARETRRVPRESPTIGPPVS